MTAALRTGDLWNSTLLIYTHDNGAPLGAGGSNFPLRGGKNSNFEGGVRVPAIIGGGALHGPPACLCPPWPVRWYQLHPISTCRVHFAGALPAARRGALSDALFHVCDWTPTIMSAIAAGNAPWHTVAPPLTDALAATIPIDGLDQWGVIAHDAPSPRTEIVLDHCLENFSNAPTGCNHFASNRSGGVGALIIGDLKLVAGPNGGEWSSFTNTTSTKSFRGVACDDYCVFNLTDDASEHRDLRSSRPDIARVLLARFAALEAEFHPPAFNPPAEDAAACAAAAAAGNFLVPWTSPAASALW